MLYKNSINPVQKFIQSGHGSLSKIRKKATRGVKLAKRVILSNTFFISNILNIIMKTINIEK